MHPVSRRGPAYLAPTLLALSAAAQDTRRATLEEATKGLPAPTQAPAATQPGSPFKLLDVSLDALFAVGSSTERDASLQNLQGGGHDPRKRGFTVQNVELSLSAAVDPYFQAEAHVIYMLDPISGESVFELEEAYATTLALPGGLQAKAGHYFTEFGIVNQQHPHSWDWLDQPVVATRLFGPDGMRGPGARLGWLLPVDPYVELIAGVQNASGETMASFGSDEELFGERPIGGRLFTESEVHALDDLVWSARLRTSFDLDEETTVSPGASFAFGPNATGGSGDTWLWGFDLHVKWRPPQHERGWPFVVWQTEVLGRLYDTAEQVDENDPSNPGDDVLVPGDRLRDFGLYSQVLWGWQRDWAIGLRGEWASGSGENYDAAADALVGLEGDPFRDDRLRISPLLVYKPSEFSRLRLQYNYDAADHLADDHAHSFWLGFEVLIGKHPTHRY
jgi:hypothetical protein